MNAHADINPLERCKPWIKKALKRSGNLTLGQRYARAYVLAKCSYGLQSEDAL